MRNPPYAGERFRSSSSRYLHSEARRRCSLSLRRVFVRRLYRNRIPFLDSRHSNHLDVDTDLISFLRALSLLLREIIIRTEAGLRDCFPQQRDFIRYNHTTFIATLLNDYFSFNPDPSPHYDSYNPILTLSVCVAVTDQSVYSCQAETAHVAEGRGLHERGTPERRGGGTKAFNSAQNVYLCDGAPHDKRRVPVSRCRFTVYNRVLMDEVVMNFDVFVYSIIRSDLIQWG